MLRTGTGTTLSVSYLLKSSVTFWCFLKTTTTTTITHKKSDDVILNKRAKSHSAYQREPKTAAAGFYSETIGKRS